MRQIRLAAPFAAFFTLACVAAAAQIGQPRAVVLVSGTVVDVSDFGHGNHDIVDSVVIIRGDKIERVGSRSTTTIPNRSKLIDCRGCYILPGLVDGFAGVNSQAQANASLYMGVTTVVASQDDRRGHLKLDANPTPHLYPIDSAGSQDDYSLLIGLPEWTAKLKEGATTAELTPEDTRREIAETARRGTRAIWLGHNLTSANTRSIIQQCRALGLATYGEFISTSYQDGISDGVQVLLHMSRYELGLVPADLLRPLIADPEEKAQDPAYTYLMGVSSSDPAVRAYARAIRNFGTALMPTFSLEYLELPGHQNLWNEPAAAILDPKDLHRPPDRTTGEAKFASDKVRDRVLVETQHFWELNRAMHAENPVYLAASGASAMGTMPGISMHTELELLVRLGLTPREALAAATSNYAAKLGWRELGSIEAGRRADMLILSEDPTRNIANSRKIRFVVLDGKVLDRDALLKPTR